MEQAKRVMVALFAFCGASLSLSLAYILSCIDTTFNAIAGLVEMNPTRTPRATNYASLALLMMIYTY